MRSGPMAARRVAAAWSLVVLVALAGSRAVAAEAIPEHPRFRLPSATTQFGASRNLLTDEERAFVAALPPVRVAIPLPPPRPYEFVDADGVVSGIHADLLVALGNAFGIRLVPVVLPSWTEALAAARERRVDVVMTLGVTDERMRYLAFTLGATPLVGALYARSGAPPIDLAAARFALERNYLANDHVRRQYPNASILTVETVADALAAVADRRADYYLGSLLEASDWLSRHPVGGVEAVRLHNYGTGYYHFGVRSDWAPLAGILNKGIQAYRSDAGTAHRTVFATLPEALRPRPPLPLDTDALAVLAKHPLWRVGAVRGLKQLNEVDANGVHAGIAAEYTEEVARRLGIAVRVVGFDSVAAMLDGLRRGDIDVVPFLTRTEGREREFVFSTPYLEMPYMLVARSDAPIYWSLDSLAGRRLALAREHPLREVLATRYPAISIVDAANGNEAMDRVAAGEADAAVEVKMFANVRINGDNDGALRATTVVDDLPAQFHFATGPARRELLPLIDAALADIPDPERTRMLRRWVAIDLQPAFPWRRYRPALLIGAASLLVIVAGTAWWMARLRREIAARRRSDELLNDVARSVPGVAFRYVLGPDGALRQHYFTPGARAFLGLPLDPRRTLLAAIAPAIADDERDAALAAEAQCLRTGQRLKLTVALRRPDAPAPRWLHLEAERTRVDADAAVWTGYVVDVSPERELQERIRRDAQGRHLLLASASHELRAPANNLLLALDSVAAPDLPRESASAVRIAQSAARTLTGLLADVLDAARVDGGGLRLRSEEFDLTTLLAELGESWRTAAGEKGLRFAVAVDDTVPRRIVGDPVRVRQVLDNLLSNAHKYTDRGEFGLDVTRTEREIVFAVSDSGVGIAPDALERLYEPYETLGRDGSDAGGRASLGLGLYVSKRIADLMGASLVLGAGVAGGTRAEFRMPLSPDPRVDAVPIGDAGATIVVCDDDAATRMLLVRRLEARGLVGVEAATAAEALEAGRRHRARILVTDRRMPGVDGGELARRWRDERGGDGRTIVILCSGDPPDPRGPEFAAFDDVLEKPVDAQALAASLSKLGVRA